MLARDSASHVQFSSYDRRSTTADAPGWFSNSDCFGGEFLKVLREPAEGRDGLYLLAEATGPGAILRGWSAGMDGVLRVYLDPAGAEDGKPVYEGRAFGFLARRAQFLQASRLSPDRANAFTPEDADYFPIPFAKGLKVTWEGKLKQIHFYHLQVRLYPEGTAVLFCREPAAATQFRAAPDSPIPPGHAAPDFPMASGQRRHPQVQPAR